MIPTQVPGPAGGRDRRHHTYVLPARRLADNSLDAWARVLGNGREGYVGKDRLSPYRGGVTRSWLKVKVPGWTDPEDKFKRVRFEDHDH
jgi:ATP-dependent DNA ligase